MIYLLDTNIFIQAKNLHYGFDFCPAFWDWLIEQNEKGKVFSIEKVGAEINAGNDELSQWANKQVDGFFLKPDAKMAAVFPTVSQWASSQSYEAVAINAFLQVADYYLVCHALGHGLTIVTHEVPANTKKRIKFMSPYEKLRHEQARFILGTE